MRHTRRRATILLPPILFALAAPAAGADLPGSRHPARHRAPPAVGATPRIVVVAPTAATEMRAARAPFPSPTALVLPGAMGVPAFVDLSPVFAPQRDCGPGYSPDALQSCRRHGELRVACGPSGTDCIPLPPDPLPYGPGPAARLAY